MNPNLAIIALFGTAATLSQTTSANCLVEGDMMFAEGQSIGSHIGLECINSTSYDGTTSVCGPNGEVIDEEMQFTCDDDVPYCMQCGPRGWGAALCLSTPDLGNRDCSGGDDEEDFLPDSTPAPVPGAVMIEIGYFDQCESDQDIAMWTANGGEAASLEHANYCSRTYNVGCLLDSDCIQTCFQETYGYSKECSVCFGTIPACSMSNGCTMNCIADSLGAECQECNAPCIVELNECTGLPEVDSSAIEAPKTVAPIVISAPPTANPAPLLTPKPSSSPNIRSSSPTTNPSTSPMVQTTSSTPEPTSKPTDNPVTSDTTSKPTDNPVTTETTAQPTDNPVTSKTTAQPTDNPVTSETTAQPTDNPISSETTAQPTENPVTSETTAQPTENPITSETTSQPTYESSSTTPSPSAKPIDPLPSSASPTGAPSAGPITPLAPDNNRGGETDNNAASSKAPTMAVFVVMGLLAAAIV